MIKKIGVVLCLLMCFSVAALAASYKIDGVGNIDMPDSYHVYTRGADLKDEWSQKNLPAANRVKLKQVFKDPKMSIFAYSEDLHAMVMVFGVSDKTTKEQWNFTDLSDKELLEKSSKWDKLVAKPMNGKGEKSISQAANGKYVCYQTKERNMYIRIENGQLFVLLLGANGGQLTAKEKEAAKSMVENIKYEVQDKPGLVDKLKNDKEMKEVAQSLLKRSGGKSVLGALVGAIIGSGILAVRWLGKRRAKEDDQQDKKL